MKYSVLLYLFLPFIGFAQPAKNKKDVKAIQQNIQAHIKFLADDKLEGREAGSPGEQLAINYIVSKMQDAGLKPAGTNGFLQPFEINNGKIITFSNNSLIAEDDSLILNEDYYPLSFSGNGKVSGYSSVSLKEQLEPWLLDVKDVLQENKQNPHYDINNFIRMQAQRALEKKGTALCIINTGDLTDNILFNKNDSAPAVALPVIYITKKGMAKFYKDAITTYSIDLEVNIQQEKLTAHNILGFVDNKAENTVIIGAHYDHLGYGKGGNSLDGAGLIHNGADDNASGTAALLELARLLKKSKVKNNNYLFIAFSAEEKGLLGSRYWLQKPSIHIQPNYMINMDMVGRYDADKKLTVGGFGTSSKWGQVIASVKVPGIEIRTDSSGSGPSDHASFYRAKIPVLFFFTNGHQDYHKATDDFDKINYAAETSIIQYITGIITATDNLGKLDFLPTRDAEIKMVALPVTLGVMPDYGFTGTGLRLDGVTAGKTAEKAGLLPGDILLQLGEYKFVDVQGYMQVLQKFLKGQSTQLHFIRDGKQKTTQVTF